MRRFLPDPEKLRESRLLRWLGPRLHDRGTWRMHRYAVARGVAIGFFFAFVLPVAQLPLAALAAFALRANPWVAAAATLVSNPVTYAPIYYAAFRIGAWIVAVPDGTTAFGNGAPDGIGVQGWFAFWWERLGEVGKPLLAGLAILATGASVLGYAATLVSWRFAVMLRRRRRLHRRIKTMSTGK